MICGRIAAVVAVLVLLRMVPVAAADDAAAATWPVSDGDTSSACGFDPPHAQAFVDLARVPAHRDSIRCVAAWGVASGGAGGAAGTHYTPLARVTRGQMASFIKRTLDLTAPTWPSRRVRLTDVQGDAHEAAIRALAAAGVVSGYPDHTYRPQTLVTRAQMAKFLVSAYLFAFERHSDDLTCAPGSFGDTQHQALERFIDQAGCTGLAKGDATGNFDPAKPVSRAQMASFLARLIAVLTTHLEIPDPATHSCAVTRLQRPPFAPADIDLLDPFFYATAVPLTPAVDTGRTEQDILDELAALLHHRFPGRPARAAAAMAIYRDGTLTDTIPDPALRAATVALIGTIGEPAVDVYRNGTYASVTWGETPPLAIAQVRSARGGLVVVFNQRYRHEPFALLSAPLLHEALHQDAAVSAKEEVIANAIETLQHLDMLSVDPALARTGSELARLLNTKAMARLNTRDPQGQLRLLESRGSVFPASTDGAEGSDVDSFGGGYGEWQNAVATPGNGLLDAVLSNISGTPVHGAPFNDDSVGLLDAGQKALTPTELTAAAEAIRLEIGPC